MAKKAQAQSKAIGTMDKGVFTRLGSLVAAAPPDSGRKGPGEKALGESGISYDDIVGFVRQLQPGQAVYLPESEFFSTDDATLKSIAIRLRNALQSERRQEPLAKTDFAVTPLEFGTHTGDGRKITEPTLCIRRK